MYFEKWGQKIEYLNIEYVIYTDIRYKIYLEREIEGIKTWNEQYYGDNIWWVGEKIGHLNKKKYIYIYYYVDI